MDEVIGWLMDEGHLPSFCTACYRAGRTGDRFMEFCKSGQIQDFCQPNALLTLGEYLCDYASPAVAEKLSLIHIFWPTPRRTKATPPWPVPSWKRPGRTWRRLTTTAQRSPIAMGERCAVVVSRRQVRPGLFQDGTGQGGVAFVRLGVGQKMCIRDSFSATAGLA